MENTKLRCVSIYALSASGQGIGRLGDAALGKVCFVRGAVPGDKVVCEILKETSSYAQGVARGFEFLSDQRSEKAKCDVFVECGGCAWMNIPYNEQLNLKKRMVREAMAKHCKNMPWFESFDVSIIPSSQLYGYRSRWQLRYRFDDLGKPSYGFFAAASHKLVAIRSCVVSTKAFHDLLAVLEAFSSKELSGLRCILDMQEFPLAQSEQGNSERARIPLSIKLRAVTPKGRDVSVLKRYLESHVLEVLQGGETGQSWLWDEWHGVKFYASSGGFLQSHRNGNTGLRAYLREKVALMFSGFSGSSGSVLDVYCGMGNFSLALRDLVNEIRGVEENPHSVKHAQMAAQLAGEGEGFCDIEYSQSRAKRDIEQRLRRGEAYDLVILNPPRTGAKEILQALVDLALGDIYYLSCYPLTLSSDTFDLLSYGFSVVECKLFDFYPHTPHVEVFMHLRRSAS